MSYADEWAVGPVILGAVFLFLIVPPLAMIALVVVALAVLVALAAAAFALPYLLVRSLRGHIAERHRPTEGAGAIARAIAQTGQTTQQPRVVS